MNRILELYGVATETAGQDWTIITTQQHCPYLRGQCTKSRKSTPEITIGSCSVMVGRMGKAVMICPNRLLEQGQIFLDCLHLLTRHEPGNQIHVVPEIAVPGGSVDYFLVSVRQGKVQDFVGLELQTVDTTGTVWPLRQQFLAPIADVAEGKGFGMNWKMTAKTTLMQLNHKVQTFEHVGKTLVLVIQDHLLAYMRSEFQFGHVQSARLGDPMQFHAYSFTPLVTGTWHIDLVERLSTNAEGVARSLGLQADPRVELAQLTNVLQAKISSATLFRWL